MRFHLTCAFALVFALVAIPVRAADWAIDVVLESPGKGRQFINLRLPFYVVLTNTTDHDLMVWKEWCSDGYFNLTFEFTGKDGKVVKVEKEGRAWDKNFPDGFVVNPGRHFVLSVTLSSIDDKSTYRWVGTENLRGVMTMKAIYKNAYEDPPAAELKIRAWIGQVESEPMQVTVER